MEPSPLSDLLSDTDSPTKWPNSETVSTCKKEEEEKNGLAVSCMVYFIALSVCMTESDTTSFSWYVAFRL